MSELHTLSLTLKNVEAPAGKRCQIRFPQLQELRYYHTSSDPNCPIFDILTSATLRTLRLYDMKYQVADTAAFQKICEACVMAFPSLHTFTCVTEIADAKIPATPPSSTRIAVSHMFAPLLRTTSMRNVTICDQDSIQVTDDDLLAFSRAWPRLRSLNLLWLMYPDPDSRVAIGFPGLLNLATGTPDLFELGVPTVCFRRQDGYALPLESRHYGLRTLATREQSMSTELHAALREWLFPNMAPIDYVDRSDVRQDPVYR
ncbi:hypothetical protein BN946_scf184851.g94 [Trametes cinnabarina]|uniref:F-box domain-containing protein n=1 Tax=Pycnoporus cinnabarinus TaxID=5643 RepID=A0A060S664_PYCCI|nr:hypothetical protein BN946_scf184851.g94 [Trametes cinnabarina]